MKDFSLNSALSASALPAALIELQGERIPLVAVTSPEPLLRGCDQLAWLQRLKPVGLSHLIVPLNGLSEDTCLFARRHLSAEPPVAVRRRQALFDLERRDEGFFSRLQFLLEAAERSGVLVGLSLFDADESSGGGPLAAPANAQGLGLGTTAVVDQERLQRFLGTACDWIAPEVRGRQNVWVEVFRRSTSFPGAVSPPGRSGLQSGVPFLPQLEYFLTRRLGTALVRARDEGSGGPWVVAPHGVTLGGCGRHVAPFEVRRLDRPVPAEAAADPVNLPASRRRCAGLFRLDNSRLNGDAERVQLWHAALRGCWPILSYSRSRLKNLSVLAAFGRQWVGEGYLRPSPAMIAERPGPNVELSAATDGGGRYFVYFARGASTGLRLNLFPGTYRYYWFDPRSGQGLDRGDGISGGRRCTVPGPAGGEEAVLILEQQELPDPLSLW